MKRNVFVAGIISMALVTAGFFTSCSSGPKVTNLKNFPASDTGNFQLFIDWNTTIKTINGEPVKSGLYDGVTSTSGNLIRLPAGEYSFEVKWNWSLPTYSAGNTVTFSWETYDPITIQETFLPNKVYDLRIWKRNDEVFHQIKMDKGEASWAKPQENETELIFPSEKYAYYVYFNDDEDYTLAIEGPIPGLRYFIPNGNHTVYIRQGRFKYVLGRDPANSNRNLYPRVYNKTNRQGVSDDLYRSTPISFTANGKKLKFRVNVCDPNDIIPKKIKLKL